MMMSTARPVRSRAVLSCLILLQVVLFAGVLVAARREAEGERAPLVRLATGVPAGVPLTIESGFAGALDRARTWAADSELFSSGMQVDWPTDAAVAGSSEIPETGWILYTFASATHAIGPGGEGATLSMLVDRKSGVLIDEQEMGWTWAPSRPLAVTTYPISSMVALFAADTTAGNSYRVACPEFRHLSRLSIVPSVDGADPFWLVTYEDQRSAGQPGVSVRIDAITGQVERDEEATEGGACGGK
jgi:hypothetical protein